MSEASPRSTPEDWVALHALGDPGARAAFASLTPEVGRGVLSEAGFSVTGSVHDYESHENRVYGFRTASGERMVAKWYRPDGWTRAAVEDEVRVLERLREEDLPTARLHRLPSGELLGLWRGVSWAVFDHVDGVEDRYEGWSHDDVRDLGRLVARLHVVLREVQTPHRLSMHPTAWTEGCVRVLEASGWLPEEARSEYVDAARALIEACAPALEALPYHPVHGDLAINNIVQVGGRCVLLDFDDMTNGPAIQDVALLHYGVNGAGPGTAESRLAHRRLVAEGYRDVLPFPADWLPLCEPLLRLRLPWFDAWTATRWHDPLFRRDHMDARSVDGVRGRARLLRSAATAVGGRSGPRSRMLPALKSAADPGESP